jgi:thiamine-monophosphate kinase
VAKGADENENRNEDKSEDKLVLRVVRALPSAVGLQSQAARARSGVALGIGDDAAILAPAKGAEWVVSTDAFLEGVHFLGDLHPSDSVGYKALARATSDLAAMGARPRLFFLTMAIPARRTGEWLDGFLRGMSRAAREFGMVLAGGDTSQFASVALAITVLGEARSGKAATRSGARPGDILYISGRMGRAQLGLELLRKLSRGRVRAGLARRGPLRRMLKPHLYPSIRVKLGAWLAERGVASAMMDLSDGLSTDLARLCAASGVGARIWADRIPCVRIPPTMAPGIRAATLDSLAMALHGGEDYELLFTVPPRRMKELRAAPEFRELTAIGEIESGGRVTLIDAGGAAKPLRAAGWDSFRKR